MKTHSLPIVWTIAASDSGGGAGIQADLKTFFDLGVHGCSAITALTAQNSQGVHQLQAASIEILEKQLQVLAEDLPPVAIKIGVLPSVAAIDSVVAQLQTLTSACVILDPVLAPTSGQAFVDSETQYALERLLPFVDLITPNIPEAQQLIGITITDDASKKAAAQALMDRGAKAVLLKGGHGDGNYCQDVFLSAEHCFWMTQQKQDTRHSHGTGCVLSSAAAAFVAHGKPLHDAVVLANTYISKGLRLAGPLGDGKRGSVAQTQWPNDWADFPQVSHTSQAINYSPMPSCDTEQLGLYPVVDSIEWLEKLLSIGITTIQLRVKDVPEEQLEVLVQQAADLGRQYDARLFINDYWQLAIKYQAYGVHLGQEDVVDADLQAIRSAGLRLGISTHGDYEFAYAATYRPSYIAIGAIFPTNTKEVVEVGLDNLYRWTDILAGHFPLVAIGGINQNNIESVVASGVGSIAVVSAITQADNYQQAVAELTHMMS